MCIFSDTRMATMCRKGNAKVTSPLSQFPVVYLCDILNPFKLSRKWNRREQCAICYQQCHTAEPTQRRWTNWTCVIYVASTSLLRQRNSETDIMSTFRHSQLYLLKKIHNKIKMIMSNRNGKRRFNRVNCRSSKAFCCTFTYSFNQYSGKNSAVNKN